MDRRAFSSYRDRFVSATRDVLAGGHSDALSEAAFPAYSDPNPLVRFLFWQRIRVVMRQLAGRHFERALDFGCGGGVMLPFLAERSEEVIALDVDLGPLEKMNSRLPLPANVKPHDAKQFRLDDLAPHSCDVILALDVLEHVDDLRGTLEQFHRVLKPGGPLLVTGPTENFAYKIGRRLAGKVYTGDYHVRSIYDIREAMEEFAPVRRLAMLYYPVPLFEIYRSVA